MKPSTRYTKSGRINIAYQVFGSGSLDIVYVPGWISNIDLMWSCPELVHFLETLGSRYRVILFDKRGTGLSDRIADFSTLEERMDDIRAVMDAVNSKEAILFGHSEGGSVSALFAATYPNRTVALITFGVFAKRRRSEHYPWAPSDKDRLDVYKMIEEKWGSGDMDLASLAPSKANDPVFLEWLADYFRSGASPNAALVLTKLNTQVDIIGILPKIKVPALLMQRTNDIDVKIEEGRFMAERIAGAKFVEFDGDDHLFWAGNTEEVLNEMTSFIEGLKREEKIKPQLLNIVVAKAITHSTIGNNSLISINPQQLNDQLIEKYDGKLHQMEGGLCIAMFEGSNKAINFCLDFRKMLNGINMEIKAGIHLGQYLIEDSGAVEGSGIGPTIELQEIADRNQILVTQTIRNLLSISDLKFDLLEGVRIPQLVQPIFTVDDRYLAPVGDAETQKAAKQKNGLFLDNILRVIDENIGDEGFGIEVICKELGLSERQLQRKIKAITNKSPNQMIRSVRLHRAKEMLLIKLFTIAEIAFQTGFSSPSYFSKCFREQFGIAPSDLLE